MKANEFVREFGWDEARRISEAHNSVIDGGDGEKFHINDLKRLVESYKLIESLGGLDKCKQDIQNMRNCELKSHLSFHVEAVESCND